MTRSDPQNGESLSLRHLRLFAVVTRAGSIRRASELVHLSQPAVTQAMIKLERLVGATFFDRTSNGTSPTRAGEIFARRVDAMSREIEEALGAFGVVLGHGCTLSQVAERVTRSQIRDLAAITHGKSIAEAARILGVSQPSIHRAARELERNIGKSVFQQSANGLVTSRAGAELSRRLSLALREVDWGIEEVHAAAGEHLACLKVGAMPLAGSFLLAHVLNDITQRYTGLRVQVETGPSEALRNALMLGDIDFLLGMVKPELDPAEVHQEQLILSRYLVVARRTHPLAGRTDIGIDDLSGYDWIMPVIGATRRAAFDRLFRMMPRMPRANIETHSLATIRLLLSGSDRLTLMTRFEFEYERNGGDLIALNYSNIEPLNSIGVATRARWNPTAIHVEFLDIVRQHALRTALQGDDIVLLPRRADRSRESAEPKDAADPDDGAGSPVAFPSRPGRPAR